MAETLTAESLTRVLYPGRFDLPGPGTPFDPGIFPRGLFARGCHPPFPRTNGDWRTLPDKVAIQLNDTHPTLAVAELMRILVDEAGWLGTRPGTSPADARLYQPHVAARGAGAMAGRLGVRPSLPRHLEIIYEINRRFLEDIRARFPGDDGRVARTSLIEEGREQKNPHGAIWRSSARTARTAWPRSIRELLCRRRCADLAEMFPERFNNKTNGVTPRRWLLLANPSLADTITRRHRRRLGHRSGAIAEAQAAGRGRRLPRRPCQRAHGPARRASPTGSRADSR